MSAPRMTTCELVSGLKTLDRRVLVIARTRFHNPRAERVVSGFSRLGEHGAIWLAFGIVGQALDHRRRADWRRATCVVAGTYALNTAIKQIVRRPRPQLPGLPALTSTPTKLSFPSAHASTSVAGAISYARLGLPAMPLIVLAKGLALSRVYLGVHYPSDILAGALLGATVAVTARGPVTASSGVLEAAP
jgi:membrane-associated phospholipid phosphatase